MVVDYRAVYGVFERLVYIIMTPYEVKSSIQDTWTIYFTADMKSWYYQIPLENDSKEITTFIIPQGRFAYNLSLMGLLPSGDMFNQRTQ